MSTPHQTSDSSPHPAVPALHELRSRMVHDQRHFVALPHERAGEIEHGRFCAALDGGRVAGIGEEDAHQQRRRRTQTPSLVHGSYAGSSGSTGMSSGTSTGTVVR